MKKSHAALLAAAAMMGALVSGMAVTDNGRMQAQPPAAETNKAPGNKTAATANKAYVRRLSAVPRLSRPTYIVKGKPGAAQFKRAARKRRNIRARLPKH